MSTDTNRDALGFQVQVFPVDSWLVKMIFDEKCCEEFGDKEFLEREGGGGNRLVAPN